WERVSGPGLRVGSSVRFLARRRFARASREGNFFPSSGTDGGPRRACYPSAMFDIGLQEMLVIGVLALLVFGPSKLPELGRMVGRALREFRRASDEFRSTVETNLHINDPDPRPPPPSFSPTARP